MKAGSSESHEPKGGGPDRTPQSWGNDGVIRRKFTKKIRL